MSATHTTMLHPWHHYLLACLLGKLLVVCLLDKLINWWSRGQHEHFIPPAHTGESFASCLEGRGDSAGSVYCVALFGHFGRLHYLSSIIVPIISVLFYRYFCVFVVTALSVQSFDWTARVCRSGCSDFGLLAHCSLVSCRAGEEPTKK